MFVLHLTLFGLYYGKTCVALIYIPNRVHGNRQSRLSVPFIRMSPWIEKRLKPQMIMLMDSLLDAQLTQTTSLYLPDHGSSQQYRRCQSQ